MLLYCKSTSTSGVLKMRAKLVSGMVLFERFRLIKLPFRPLPLLLVFLVMGALHWGLSQADSRAIYGNWDKALHAAVFFVAWWLMRWSLRGSWLLIALLAALGGGAEEVRQMFIQGHQADWWDWWADVIGVALAVAMYGMGRWLWLLRGNVEDAWAGSDVQAQGAPANEIGLYAFNRFLSLDSWRWLILVIGLSFLALSALISGLFLCLIYVALGIGRASG